MINLNEIAFIENDSFDYNDGENLITFDLVAFYPDTNKVTFAITNLGRISVIEYDVFEDKDGHYIDYGIPYGKIYIDDLEII